VRILVVTVPLPSKDKPNTMAALAHQVESLRRLGVEVEVLEVGGIPKIKYLQAWPRLGALAPRADLVHAHFGFCGWLARSQFSRPVVLSFMGSDLLGIPTAVGRITRLSRLEVSINRWAAGRMDAVIVKSRKMADVVAPVSAHVLPNGVDLDFFRPMARDEARTALGWPEGPRYVLFPGDPDNPGKGFALANAAVVKAAEQVRGQVVMVPLKKVLPEQVPLYINACEAMLMTSLSEGSPNVVKEAMACNLPVISVPVGDVPELFEDAEGYSVSPRDPGALARALVATLSAEPRVRGREALIAKGLDVMTVARRLVSIYTSVLDRQATAGHRRGDVAETAAGAE
jgi:glycosyltransferase involved in cell wall biosynthesis